MRIYTVHVRSAGARDDDVRFVKEGFSWPAFLVPVFWAAWHRMALPFVLYLVLLAALNLGLPALGLSGAGGVALSLVVALAIAWEADAVRRWSLARKGYRLVDLVAARGLAEAERAYFDRAPAMLAPPPPSARSAPRSPAPRPGPWRATARPREPEGIGLFPEAGR